MRPRRPSGKQQRVDVAGQRLPLRPGQVDVVDRDLDGAETGRGGAGEGGLAGPLRADDPDQRRAVLRSVGEEPADEVDLGGVGAAQCWLSGRRTIRPSRSSETRIWQDRRLFGCTFSAKSSIDSSMAEARPVSAWKASST